MCEHWSFKSGISIFRCGQPAVRAKACSVHLRYPDPGAVRARVEP